MSDIVDTGDEACAIACMLVSNPDGAMRAEGWQKRVNDLIRALRDERNRLRSMAGKAEVGPGFDEVAKARRIIGEQSPYDYE